MKEAQLTLFDQPASFAEDTKKIAAFMAQTLKPLGYKKRRNSFNLRLENGLIHQLSIFSVGAYSCDHGKFYVHAGCYIPEAELYRKNVIDPKWVPDYLCAVRGQFPQNYQNIRTVAANLDLIVPHLNTALEMLALFESYDPILDVTPLSGRFEVEASLATSDNTHVFFETPKPLLAACILIARGDGERASMTLQNYIAVLKAEKRPHLGHIEAVSGWAKEMGLLNLGITSGT
jgi:hypothetical protein